MSNEHPDINCDDHHYDAMDMIDIISWGGMFVSVEELKNIAENDKAPLNERSEEKTD